MAVLWNSNRMGSRLEVAWGLLPGPQGWDSPKTEFTEQKQDAGWGSNIHSNPNSWPARLPWAGIDETVESSEQPSEGGTTLTSTLQMKKRRHWQAEHLLHSPCPESSIWATSPENKICPQKLGKCYWTFPHIFGSRWVSRQSCVLISEVAGGFQVTFVLRW